MNENEYTANCEYVEDEVTFLEKLKAGFTKHKKLIVGVAIAGGAVAAAIVLKNKLDLGIHGTEAIDITFETVDN